MALSSTDGCIQSIWSKPLIFIDKLDRIKLYLVHLAINRGQSQTTYWMLVNIRKESFCDCAGTFIVLKKFTFWQKLINNIQCTMYFSDARIIGNLSYRYIYLMNETPFFTLYLLWSISNNEKALFTLYLVWSISNEWNSLLYLIFVMVYI